MPTKFITILALLPALILLPFIFIPLVFYRFLIVRIIAPLASVLSPNYTYISPISGLDFPFSIDSFLENPKGATSFIWILEGALSPYLVLRRLENLINENSSESGESQRQYDFPKLKTVFPKVLFGISYWTKRKDSCFHVSNHFTTTSAVQPSHLALSETELNCVLVNWMRKPFKSDKPLWQVLVIPELKLKGISQIRSIFAFKVHHLIGDGVSKLNLLQMLLDNDNPSQASPSLCRTPSDSKFSSKIQFQVVLNLPFALSHIFQTFFLHRDIFTKRKSSDEVILFKRSLPLQKISDLRKQFPGKITKPSIILLGISLLAGALARFLNSKEQIKPSKSNFVLALPHFSGQGHPGVGGFSNHFGNAILTVDFRTASPLKRVEKVMEEYEKVVMNHRFPQVYFKLLLKIQEQLPSFLWDKVTNFNMGAPLGATNMQGSGQEVFLCGNRVVEKFAYVGLLWRHSSLTCGFFSYNKKLSLTLVMNKDIVHLGQNAEQILQEFLDKEIALLEQELTRT